MGIDEVVNKLKADLWEIHKRLRYTETCLGCGHDWPCETILAIGVEVEEDEGEQLEHSDVKLQAHDKGMCLGKFCTIHNRSDHSMREFPQHWRGDRWIMERICTHGVGHPDPDSPWDEESSEWIHGCDGCGHDDGR